MARTKKLLAIILSVILAFSAMTFTTSATQSTEDAISTQSNVVLDKIQYAKDTTVQSIDFFLQLVQTLEDFYYNIKYTFTRYFNPDNVVIDAGRYAQFDLAKAGETVKLTKDIVYKNVEITKAVNIDLNGHTLTCDSFNYKTDAKAELTISGGKIVAQKGNIVVNAPKATINLDADTFVILDVNNQSITIDASLNTVILTNNTKFVVGNNKSATLDEAIKTGTTAPVSVLGDTRVYVDKTNATNVIIVPKESNVIIDTATTAVQPESLADGTENPNSGKSVVEVVIDSSETKDIAIISNVKADNAPAMAVTVPEDYAEYVTTTTVEGAKNTELVVVTARGNDYDAVVEDEKMPAVSALTVTLSEDASSAEISGLSASRAYEYRACYEKEYTAISAGSTSFTTSEKHIFVRTAAKGSYVASDDCEIKTGIADAQNTYTIGCADEFRELAKIVNDGNSLSKYTVSLKGDIDLNNEEWTPIGTPSSPFKAIFDGEGHTISDLKITRTLENSYENNYIGLFGKCEYTTLKNFTVNNADVSGSLYVAVIAGQPYQSATISNVKVTGDVHVYGWWYCAAFAGQGYCKIDNSVIDVNEGSEVRITGGYAGGFVGHCGEGSRVIVDTCSSNIDIYGNYNGIGGLVGILQYGNTIKNSSCSANVTSTAVDEIEEQGPCGGICGSFSATGKLVPTIDNCTFTGNLYLGDRLHDNMSHPFYGCAVGAPAQSGQGALVIK